MQKVYNLYVFAKNGVVLHYHEWWRPRAVETSQAEDAKLMFGLLHSLKFFAPKVRAAVTALTQSAREKCVYSYSVAV